MCAKCGSLNAPGDAYCGGCGNALTDDKVALARSSGASELERRQLTVMFCDLVDSTALSHQLDPEDLLEVIRGYRKSASQVIARYEGFVARYVGDGILVYFGYPHAHEDDAARAVHTGLEIVQTLDQSSVDPDRRFDRRLGVRIGIATGLVVVGDLIAEGAAEASVALGDTPNLAARLQPNSVMVAGSTRELAGGQFKFADQGTYELKGFGQPVRAWRVLRTSEAKSRFDAARNRRLTPLVGREKEIEQLLGRWQRAREGGGQVVLLSGEAGIGKSRIAEHLGERIANDPHIRLRYQCSPYHANSPLHPFIHQLEREADFRRGDSAEQKLDKLDAFLTKSAPHVGKMASIFAALLSLPGSDRFPTLHASAQQQKDKTLVALLELLRGFAAQAPVLMLFEDAHWIDPTSIEFLDLLAHHAQVIRILAVISSRSRFDYSWLDLQHVGSLQLERLDREQSAAMVRRLLKGKKFPDGLIDEIVTKTDGVPLFIEELTRTLVPSALKYMGELSPFLRRSEIPSTLQDSLTARLDQLGSAKEVAQMGAVIGREFPRDLIAAISPLDDAELRNALSTLTSSGVVFGRGQPPWTTFVFKHALVQDAAYASLLRTKRQESHQRIAETLERSYPERIRVEPEIVAHHYTQAGHSMRAAKYWTAAAQRALDRSANLEALGHASKGLDLLASATQDPGRDRLVLGLEILRGTAYRAVSGFASSDAERSFTRARELSERLDDIPRLIDARRGLFSCYYARGALSVAREQGHELAALGQRLDDSGSRMLGHWMLGCIMFWQGEFPAARTELEEAFSLYDPHDQRTKTLALQIDPGVNALFHLSWLLWILGYPDRAIQTSEQAIQTARQLAQPFALAMALHFACTTQACCRQHAAVKRLLDELIPLTAEHGLGYLGSCARVLEGQQLIAQDQCIAGLEHISRAFAEFKAQEAGVGFPWAMSIAATAYARLGRAQEGLATVSAAFAAAKRNGEHQWEAELYRLKGELLLLPPTQDQREAENCFQAALDLARRQGAKSLELRATMSLARLLVREGKEEYARRLLAEACGWFSEGSDTLDLHDARMALQALADCYEQR
jgi:class 3 adenylate cyclase/predicted ATPase